MRAVRRTGGGLANLGVPSDGIHGEHDAITDVSGVELACALAAERWRELAAARGCSRGEALARHQHSDESFVGEARAGLGPPMKRKRSPRSTKPGKACWRAAVAVLDAAPLHGQRKPVPQLRR
jgi:hypothetical protein